MSQIKTREAADAKPDKVDVQELIESKGLTAVMGIRLTDRVLGESAAGEIELEEKHINFFDIVHGGTFYTLADTVSGFAASDNSTKITTVNSSFQFFNAGDGCKKIICRSKVDKRGGHLIWVSAKITNEDEKLLCKGEFLYYVLDRASK